MSIKGNLHTTALVHDTPQQVFETAREAIQKAMRGGGFILSSGCALGRDTPPENIEAMARAAMEFGGY
jgi:uroporphyrinogen decarboxylase